MYNAQEVQPVKKSTPIQTIFRFTNSVKVWLSLVAFLLVVKLILTTFYPRGFADPSQAVFFTWPALSFSAFSA